MGESVRSITSYSSCMRRIVGGVVRFGMQMTHTFFEISSFREVVSDPTRRAPERNGGTAC